MYLEASQPGHRRGRRVFSMKAIFAVLVGSYGLAQVQVALRRSLHLEPFETLRMASSLLGFLGFAHNDELLSGLGLTTRILERPVTEVNMEAFPHAWAQHSGPTAGDAEWRLRFGYLILRRRVPVLQAVLRHLRPASSSFRE